MAAKSPSPRPTRPGPGSASGGSARRRPPPPPSRPRPWGLIAGVLALALFVGGLLTYAVVNAGSESEAGRIEQLRASLEDGGGVAVIDGLSREHVEGPVEYAQPPPAGGDHNSVWQSCVGDVYTEPIAAEHAVHSLEHGAVWVTHRPDLPAEQVEVLAGQVRGTDYLMMSPVAGQPAPVVLTAWGRQLQVDSADDPRVAEFIRAYRVSATQEPGATCSSPLTVQGVDEPLTRDQLASLTGGGAGTDGGS